MPRVDISFNTAECGDEAAVCTTHRFAVLYTELGMSSSNIDTPVAVGLKHVG